MNRKSNVTDSLDKLLVAKVMDISNGIVIVANVARRVGSLANSLDRAFLAVVGTQTALTVAVSLVA